MKRCEQLDWLRGLMAFTILVYHSAAFAGLGWTTDASSVLGRLGIYGVSIFFVLSGLSMAMTYATALGDGRAVAQFAVRRAFRIWPLLTLAVALSAVLAWRNGTSFDPLFLIANATGLFGFIFPSAYIATGSWSIGNEMVYYALTPVLL